MTRRNLPALLWGAVVCALLAHTGYLWLAKRIAPEADILALLPVAEDDPVLQRASRQMVESGQQRLMVLIGAEDWDQAVRAADAYHLVLASHADLLLDARTAPAAQDWLAWYKPHRSTLLTPRHEAELDRLPADFWVERALGRLYSPFAGLRPGAWQDDPFGLFEEWTQIRLQETVVRPRDGRLFVGDGKRDYVVMPFELRVAAFSLASQRALMPLLMEAEASARRAVPQAEVSSAAIILYAAAAGKQASLELSTIGLGSLLGIVGLTWATFRSLKPIALVMLSLAVGCLGALAVCWWLFERIHLLTLVFGASLIGAAQDYGTYFMCNRFSEASRQLDSQKLLRRLLPALVLALVTTLIGYLALALTPFPGLRQMAVFSASGLLFAWFTVVCWFPVLMCGGATANVRLAQCCAAMMARWPAPAPNLATAALVLALIGLTVFGLWRLDAQDDLRLLQNPPEKLVADQLKVGRLLDAPSPAQFYIVRGASAETVLQREEKLKERLDRLVENELIAGYQAISNWLPSLQTQAERRQALERSLVNGAGPLAILAQRIGEDRSWAVDLGDRLLAATLPLTPEHFFTGPVSEPWRHLWLGRIDGDFASIVALRGVNRANLGALQQAGSALEGVQWIDRVSEISAVLGAYRQYLAWVVVLSYAAVFGLLYPRYRGSAWRVVAPTALASLATLALLGAAGVNLHLFHVLGLMLLLGIGVDYGIFLREHSSHGDPWAWLAVALSALSTLLSFGLLGLSKTPALHAFGLTLLIGTVALWLIVPFFTDHPARQDERSRKRRAEVAS